MKKIYILKTEAEIERAFPVMKELRPHLSFNGYLEIYKAAHECDDYQIAVLELDGHIVALMGFRFLSDFIRGRHLYIDDLVSSENMRSMGFGKELLKFAEKMADQSNCNVLRLCTGIDNNRGIKFYEDNDWTKKAFAFTKKMSTL